MRFKIIIIAQFFCNPNLLYPQLLLRLKKFALKRRKTIFLPKTRITTLNTPVNPKSTNYPQPSRFHKACQFNSLLQFSNRFQFTRTQVQHTAPKP